MPCQYIRENLGRFKIAGADACFLAICDKDIFIFTTVFTGSFIIFSTSTKSLLIKLGNEYLLLINPFNAVNARPLTQDSVNKITLKNFYVDLNDLLSLICIDSDCLLINKLLIYLKILV